MSSNYFLLTHHDPPIDDVYEDPTDAELAVDITKQTIPEIVHGIMLLLETNGLL